MATRGRVGRVERATARATGRSRRPRCEVRATRDAVGTTRGRAKDDDYDDDDEWDASASTRERRRGRRRQYLRLVRDDEDESWRLQSAELTLRARREDDARTLRVCALVHYGDAAYYEDLAKDFGTRRRSVTSTSATLAELITSRENLCASEDDLKLWRLSVDLAPTPEARALARAHGLRAQMDALDAKSEGFYVADVTREELIALREEAGELGSTRAAETARNKNASVATSGGKALPPALEAMAVTALGRASGGDPGKIIARLSCWFVPCPEAHLLLLDWVWAGGRPSNVLGAMVDCCASGDLESARRLAFAQMIVSAQAEGPVGGGAAEPVLVARRNDVAIDGVKKAFKSSAVDEVNLLYGGLHVPGLVRCARERLDMDVVDTAWRDAWRVQPPKNASPLRYAIVPILLGVDGTDWAQTLHDAVALGPSAGVLSLFLYIVRHGALYYALGKWLLEWNRQLFDADVGPSPENVTE